MTRISFLGIVRVFCFLFVSSFSISKLSAQSYCNPTFANGCFSWMNSAITLNTINWTSSSCTLFDYTSLSTTLQAGSSYPMSVSNGNWCGCAVWIDFDHSGTFDPAENLYHLYNAQQTQTYNFNITIPPPTPNGTYRMRVIAPWGSDGFTAGPNGSGGCGAYQYGNFDDFTINISAPCVPTTDTISVNACNSYTSPGGNTYSSSGIYNDTIPNSGGCDSIININLNVSFSSLTTISPAACGSYVAPSGIVFNSSGSYFDTIPNSAGCDSVIRIFLTINSPSSSSIFETACDQYIAPSGALFTTAGIHNDTIPNAVGCDSVITIDLTLNASVSTAITPSACDSWTSPAGNIYTVSGSYIDTLNAINGCDSLIHIQLTITDIDTSVSVSGSTLTSAQSAASYEWHFCDSAFSLVPFQSQQILNALQSGTYCVVITQNGCMDTSGCHTVILSGRESENALDRIFVYPNPAKNLIYVEFNNAISDNADLQLCDATGRVMMNKTVTQNKIEIDLSDVAAGIYFIIYDNGNSKSWMKIQKEN